MEHMVIFLCFYERELEGKLVRTPIAAPILGSYLLGRSPAIRFTNSNREGFRVPTQLAHLAASHRRPKAKIRLGCAAFA